jgi:hypothetical protein
VHPLAGVWNALGRDMHHGLAIGLVAVVVGWLRLRWLEARCEDAGVRLTSGVAPSYWLQEGVGWARFELHASPHVLIMAVFGAGIALRFGLFALLTRLQGGAVHHDIDSVAFGGLIIAFHTLPHALSRMEMRIEPGVLTFELHRLGRRVEAWQVKPRALRLEVVKRHLVLHTEYVEGYGVPGTTLFDAGLGSPDAALVADLERVGATFTAIAEAR